MIRSGKMFMYIFMESVHLFLMQITMWDLANGKLLRTITDAHPPGTAILHVKVLNSTFVCNLHTLLFIDIK